jgi:hypothetical protein
MASSGDRVTSLGDRVTSFGRRVTSFGDRVTSFGDRVTAFGDRVTSLGERVTSLGDRVTSFGDRVTSFGRRVTSFGRRVTSFGRRVTAFGDRVTAFGDRVTSCGGRRMGFRPGTGRLGPSGRTGLALLGTRGLDVERTQEAVDQLTAKPWALGQAGAVARPSPVALLMIGTPEPARTGTALVRTTGTVEPRGGGRALRSAPTPS